MKKNFVKKTLATTLALAMVATSAPAALTASAAKAPALNKKAKTLYINENEIGSSYNFNVKNTVKGSKYKWTTSNKSVVKVNSANGVVKAGTKTGKATITCKITFKTKKTKTLKATVTVKENATKVWIKNAPETTVGIGEKAYDFNSSFSTASGAKATDYRTWEIDKDSNTAGATINAKTGVVATTKTGEFKVRVRAYQNKAKLAANDTVDSDWLTVKVVSSVKTVAQSATSKVLVTFDDNMKETVKAENFTVTNKKTNAVNGVKEISFSEDGKQVTVTTYGKFEDAGTYVLTYGGKDFEFTTSIGAVETIELATTTVNPNEAKEIKYVLKNANGVDITDTVDASQVEFTEVENKSGFFNSSNKELTLFEKGSTAKFKLTYHSQKYNTTTGAEEGNKTVEAVITCVDKTAATYGTFEKYTLVKESETSIDWAKVTTTTKTLNVNDVKNLFVKAKDSTGKDATGLKFKSSNDNVVLVDDKGDYAKLKAVKEGTANVNVYTSNDVYLWSLPVEVKAEGKASYLVLDKTSVNVAKSSSVETLINVTVKNQHNETMTGDNLFEVTALDGAPSIVTAKDGSLSITATTATEVGKTYKYKVALKNDTTKYVTLSVTVKDAGVETGISLQVSKTTLDTTLSSSSKKSDLDLNIKVVTVDANGLAVKDVTNTATITVEGPSGFDKQTVKNGVFSAYTTSGTSIVKIPTGTYKVTAQYTIKDASGKDVTKYDGKTFTITDSQAAPSKNVTKKSSSATTIAAAIADCVEVKLNGEVLNIVSSDYVDFGNSISVKNVYVEQKFADVTLLHKVAVGETITYNK